MDSDFVENALRGPLIRGMTALQARVFRKLFPYQPPSRVPERQLEKWKCQCHWVEIASLIPFALLTIICAVAWTFALYGLARLRDRWLPPSLLVVKPDWEWVLWAAPALLFGIVSGRG